MASEHHYSKLEKEPVHSDAPVTDGSLFHHADPELAGERIITGHRRRRHIAVFTTLACFFYIIFAQEAFYRGSAPTVQTPSVEDRALKILEGTPLIGMNSDKAHVSHH